MTGSWQLVPADLVELWSSRDREIDEEQARLEDELGKPVGKAARLIISARTRQHKDLAEHMAQRRVRWQTEAEACAPGVVDQLQGLEIRTGGLCRCRGGRRRVWLRLRLRS